MTAIDVVQRILIENWAQFSTNLTEFSQLGEPEQLHQARICWRRLSSSRKFFQPLLPDLSLFPKRSLRPLLDQMGTVRDMDVALALTLPQWRTLYTQNLPKRAAQWDAMVLALRTRREHGRISIAKALREPGIQSSLREADAWIRNLHACSHTGMADLSGRDLRAWIDLRLRRLYRKLDHWRHRKQPHGQHKVRLLAKQLRYEVELPQNFLSGRWERRALRTARSLQTDIGLHRDRERAYELVRSLHGDTPVAQFIDRQVRMLRHA